MSSKLERSSQNTNNKHVTLPGIPVSTKRSLGFGVYSTRRCRHCLQVRGTPCEDDGDCEHLRSSRSHDVGEEDGSRVAAEAEPDTPYLAARHRSSRLEV